MSSNDGIVRSADSGLISPLTAGGIRQSCLTLIQTALGAGFLTLPFAMNLCGVGLGLVLVVIDGLVVYFGIEVMMRGAVQMGEHDTATLLSKCVGKWSLPALDLFMVCYGIGTVSAYFILLGDFMPSVLNDMATLGWIAPIELSKAVFRSRCILGSLLVVVPLSIPATLGALRYATPAGIIAVLSTSAMIMVYCPANFEAHLDEPDFGAVNWWTVDMNFFKAFSILIFAYNCHLNIVPVASELQASKRSSRHIAKVTGWTVVPLILFYGSIGAFGYLSFFKQTQQNVLNNYSLSPAVTTCRLLLCCSLIVAVPTNLVPAVRSLQGFLKVCCPALAPRGGLQESLLPDTGAAPAPQNALYTLVMKALCLSLQVSIALTVSSVADVMAFIGASVGMALMMGTPLAVLFTARFDDYSRFKFSLAVLVLGGCMILSMVAFIVMVLQKMGVVEE